MALDVDDSFLGLIPQVPRTLCSQSMAYPISLKLVSISLIIICKFNIPSVTALRCYTCDSAKDKNCQFLQTNKNPEQNCATQCFSFRSLEGTVFERGCLSSKAPCGVVSDLNGDPCTKCTTDLCNSAPLAFDKCAFCNSASDLDCENTSNSTKIVECPATTAAREGCYRYSESWNGGVERGCVSDLREETFQVCSDAQGDICKMCKGDYCNLKGMCTCISTSRFKSFFMPIHFIFFDFNH